MGGCTASKLDNEDTVRRCKERRRLIKEAVFARHQLAAAHSDYLRSLRLTGAALVEFSSGESLSVSSDHTQPILLHTPSSSFRSFSIPEKPNLSSNYPPSPSISSSVKPPPAPPSYSPSSSPTIRSSKLPHILSESSLNSTPRYKSSNKFTKLPSFTTYDSTPSQASSVWNWENFYPPSPPDSEFFEKVEKVKQSPQPLDHHLDQNHHDDETEQEEVHCSEWGDHYSSTSSDTESVEDEDDDIDKESRSEIGSRSNFGSSVQNEPQLKSKSSFRAKSEKFDEAGSSVSWNAGGSEEINDMKMVVRHRDLSEIAGAIKEYFEKAASAGESVAELLETGRAQLDRSFRQLKKTVYHSNSMLSSLSSSWTSKPPLAIKYKLDAGSIAESDSKSHGSTLEQLLAWEKKLYEEVKAREGVNIEHERKLSSLQSQEYKGEDEAKLDKTKTTIKRLQSLILVTSQAVSTTSSAIIQVRDTELAPQLVDFCHQLMYMWRSMNQFHEIQNHIVQQVRGLVNQTSKGESTSELHRQATSHLESTISAWHSSFCRLIKYQRDYIRSLHGWLKLTFLQVDNTNTSKDPSSSELVAFLDEWKQALDRCPDTVASESIKSFVNVIHVITVKQTEELKIKKKAESVSRELEKKSSSLRNLEKKFYQSYSTVGLGIPDGGQVIDTRDPLSEKKMELAACQRRVEDEISRHGKAIEVTRSMTLNNIQTGLPGVFQAMTGFSGLFAEALEGVCTRSYSIK
ncbi:hypothetical protein ACHQM5_001528 [Ranunculus cassubicifolius]